jgi:hypothetical protein
MLLVHSLMVFAWVLSVVDKRRSSVRYTHRYRPFAYLRHAAIDIILTNTTTHSSLHLAFYGRTASFAVFLPDASSDGTKLGLERSTSKMTRGSVAIQASA